MAKIGYYLIEGGHDGDPDPEQAGRVRARKMGGHGPGVKTEHLPFSQLLSPGSGNGANEFNRPPPPGTIVSGFDAAESVGYIHTIGIPIGIMNPQSIAGNDGLDFVAKAAAKTAQKALVPPQASQTTKEDNRTGLSQLTKLLQEGGGNFSFQSLNGILSSGAVFGLSGLRNTPLQKIATALETNVNAMTSSKLSGLPTSGFDLGSVLGGADGGGLSSGLQSTLQSALGNLTSDKITTQPDKGAMFGNQVDPTKMISQFQSALGGVTNTGGLMDAIKNIQSPASMLQSVEGLSGIENKIQTMFGEITQKIGLDGSITNLLPSGFSDLLSQFTSLFQNILAGAPGETLFSQAGTQFNELFDRLGTQGATQQLNQLVQGVSDLDPVFNRMRNGVGTQVGSRKDIAELQKRILERTGKVLKFFPEGKGDSGGGNV